MFGLQLMFILGLVCLVAALVLVLRPVKYKFLAAALPAWVGMLLLHFSTRIYLKDWVLPFWGLATLVVIGLRIASPSGEPDGNRVSNIYVGLSAIAGGMLGIIVSPTVLVLGVVLGAMVGTFAYGRTPAGAWLNFPSRTFVQYMCAKGLPIVVAVAIIGIALEGFIS